MAETLQSATLEHLLRATARAEAHHFWFRGFRAFMRPFIERAVGNNREARILDCGCGTGANVEMLGRFGRAFGFDLSPVGLCIGRELRRFRLVRAAVGAAPFPSNAFDLVTSFDVLYALGGADERAAVAEMFRMTRPGGYTLINVAAMPALRGDHSVLGHEVRRYRRPDLQRLVTGAGFTVVRLTYTNVTLVLPLLATRTAQRWRGLKQEEESTRDLAVPIAPINALLTGLLLLESAWVGRFDSPCGSSLVCLAQKPAATGLLGGA